jgi:AraC-like DNA-binding protein
MTYFDISEIESSLSEAVYGGPALPLEMLRQYFAERGIHFPCQVLAIQGQAQGFGEGTALRLHRGLTYLCLPNSPEAIRHATHRLSSEGLAFGTAFPCPNPGRWIWAVQEAIISLRERELNFSEQDRDAPPDLAHQTAAQQTAMDAVKRSYLADGSDWQEAVETWLRIVLVRNKRRVNDARRRLVEMLTDLIRDVEDNPNLATLHGSAMRRLYATYDFAELRDVFLHSLREIRPLLVPFDELQHSIGPSSRIVRRALRWMLLHYIEPIGLAETAAAVHVSPPHLARLFRRHTGRTVTEYLHTLRISHARQLLLSTEETVLAIGLASGFSAPEHFYRTFRRLTGTTPAAYRALYR